jgi:trimethylamine--corrinoid protein Co-methyltransferase
VRFHPWGGLTDAKRPSAEAGAQKMLTAWPYALCGGATIETGRLAGDWLYSPIQMILDMEMAGAMKRALRGFEINEETLAAEVVDQVGPGGLFAATEHAALHFRDEQWQPSIWARESLQAWHDGDRKTDVERARDRWYEVMAQPDPPPAISEETEKRLWAVVDRAERGLR